MKINTKNVIIAFLVIMSLTSYVFLSNIQVNEPSPVKQTEIQEAYPDNAQIPTTITMPDLSILRRIINILSQAAA